MEQIEQLIILLNEYLKQEMMGPSWLDNLIIYVLPAISSIVLLGTAVAGYIKYKTTKNREIYEKILYGVYSPLYQYFVKQEMYCAIHLPKRIYKDSPIIELINTKQSTKWTSGKVERKEETTTLFNLSREEFLSVRDDINTGLASQELLTLLNMYEVLIFMEDKYDKDCDEFLQATSIKIDVENALRKEVFTGYQNYYSKLGLDQNMKVDFWTLSKDNIKFNVLKSTEQLKKVKQELIELEKNE